MRAITIYQPWAHLIATGRKRIENRSWATAHRGPLLIHAGLSRRLLATHPDVASGALDPAGLAFGAVVGIVDLFDCVPAAAVAGRTHAIGPWCWLLEDPIPLEPPVPLRGMQGLFDVPVDDAIRAALARRSRRP
jgi:hypothetical protein